MILQIRYPSANLQSGIYLIVGFTTLIRTPNVGMSEVDADLAEAEEEGLLGSTGRRFNAAWSDIVGSQRKKNPAPRNDEDYGTVDRQ